MDDTLTRPLDVQFDSQDGKACLGVIANLPLTDVNRAHGRLLALLEAMNQRPPAPAMLLQALEMARAPLAGLQEEISAHYAFKPLPPNEAEDSALRRVVAAWRAMARGYSRVAQMGGGDPAIESQLAMICQRCIHYAGQMLIEHYRAHRSLPPFLWIDLHGYYDTAEEFGLANTPVIDALAIGQRSTTCAQTYASILLVDLADPYSRTPRDLARVVQWGQRFAHKVAIVRPHDDEGSRGYGLDLMRDQGLLPVDSLAATETARLFDTSELGPKLRRVAAALKEGATPASLGLGADCPPDQAARLLVPLYRSWSQAARVRRFERERASGTLDVAIGLDSVHFHITGKEFLQPEHVRSFTRAEMDALWTFRSQVDPTQPLSVRSAKLGYSPEQWQLLDRSVNGFRVRRPAGVAAPGVRIDQGQLLGLKAENLDHFILARVSWLTLESNGDIQLGLQVIPGAAEGIAVRATGANITPSEKYTRGFLLPAVPVLEEPPCLILPRGWYQPDRVVEGFTDQIWYWRLTGLMQKGPDFDRCAFAAAKV